MQSKVVGLPAMGSAQVRTMAYDYDVRYFLSSRAHVIQQTYCNMNGMQRNVVTTILKTSKRGTRQSAEKNIEIYFCKELTSSILYPEVRSQCV